MSFRDAILENVRNNQPAARELPAIPNFHSEQPVDLKNKFAAALKELSGERPYCESSGRVAHRVHRRWDC
jgi:hypothetical protein